MVRKINYLNGYSYKAQNIHKKLIELQIKPCPSVKNIQDILKICGSIEDNVC